ncbi:MAG TPA: Uma2 family endonuclease [Urbifossiella sp.]|jgi:Uma2 family endonuclease|nr:Uma2 family endonuclease [Urbifossiella sp.]
MSAVLTPSPVLPEDYPNRFRWTIDQYRELGRLGFLGDRRVMLLDGVIYDQYPPHPDGPAPAPVKLSQEQYRRLGNLGYFNGRRVELLHGEVVEMSPQGWPHVVAKSKTADVLRAVFAGAGWVNEQSPFPTAGSDPEPDVVVAPGRQAEYMDHPTIALLLVEVADTTLDRDTTTKAEMYATAGVEDYWVLDVVGRQLIVFRDPQPIPDGGAAYRSRTVHGPAACVAPLNAPAATVAVSDLLP